MKNLMNLNRYFILKPYFEISVHPETIRYPVVAAAESGLRGVDILVAGKDFKDVAFTRIALTRSTALKNSGRKKLDTSLMPGSAASLLPDIGEECRNIEYRYLQLDPSGLFGFLVRMLRKVDSQSILCAEDADELEALSLWCHIHSVGREEKLTVDLTGLFDRVIDLTTLAKGAVFARRELGCGDCSVDLNATAVSSVCADGQTAEAASGAATTVSDESEGAAAAQAGGMDAGVDADAGAGKGKGRKGKAKSKTVARADAEAEAI